MLKSAEKTGTNEYSLALGIPAEEFEAAVNRAYHKTKNNINVPGFRKGKAPRTLIERKYGENIFYDDALEIAFPDVYEKAVDEAGISPVDQPRDFDIRKIGRDGVELTCKVTVKPEITLEGYKGLSAVRLSTEVTQQDVETELQKRLENSARIIDAGDRAVQKGDIAVIDFDGCVDGKAFDGGKADNYELEIGSGSFIPGFEDQIIGHSAGDEFDVNVSFPKDYAESLAGKAAIFKTKLNTVKIKELPAADDEFAKDISEFDTLDELKADIKKHLEEQKKNASDKSFENEIYDKLAGLVKDEIPEAMVENATERMLSEFKYDVEARHISLEQYLGYLGMTVDSLRKTYRARAEKDVKIELALEKAAELESIEVSDEEIDKEFEAMAESYKADAEAVRKAIMRETVRKELAKRKAGRLILESAVEEAETEKKKPAEESSDGENKTERKKPAVKKTAAKKAAASGDVQSKEEKPKAKRSVKKKSESTDGEAKTE